MGLKVDKWQRTGGWGLTPASYVEAPFEETDTWLENQVATMRYLWWRNRPQMMVCFYCDKTYGANSRTCYWCGGGDS